MLIDFDIMFQVFTHPYLLQMLLSIENILRQPYQHNSNLNILLSDYLIESEGPFYKYERMFSDERIFEVNNNNNIFNLLYSNPSYKIKSNFLLFPLIYKEI